MSHRLRTQSYYLRTIFVAVACALSAGPVGVDGNEPAPLVIPGTAGKALPAPQLPPSPFTIAILPDRTAGKPWGIPYLKTAITELNLIQPDVVFNLGDMVQGYTRKVSTYRHETEEYLQIVGALDAPFYPLPGNHEVISGYRNSNDRQFETLYQEIFGPLYYAVQFEHVTTLSLYTDEELSSEVLFHPAQLDWTKIQIKAAAERGKTLVVLMHKPAWRYRHSNWDEIHTLLAAAVQSAGIQVVVVAGHFHSLQRDPDRDGVQYHLVGTCGALIDQHPLSGQLQHLSFLKILPGRNDSVLYHHPIGCTLPDDFVRAEDQRRSHRLKTSRRICTIDNVLEQPLGKPIIADLELSLHNPIDRTISILPALVKAPPTPSIVNNYGFVSRTQLDIFNPYVTNVDTPFEQRFQLEPVTLQPNETKKITLPLRVSAQGQMLPPPEIRLTATFVDTQDRMVPVFIRRRVPLTARYVVTDTLALNMPISAWRFSVYDLRERDPLLGISATGGYLNLALAVFDNQVAYQEAPDLETRINDPMSDTVIVSFGPAGPGQTRFLIEPRAPEHLVYRIVEENETAAEFAGGPTGIGRTQSQSVRYRLVPEPTIKVAFENRTLGFGLFIAIPLERVGAPGETVRFNLKVSDNDHNYFTHWRQWSPDQADSTIVLPPHF